MPKGIRKDYSKDLKITAVYLMQKKAMPPKEIFQLLGGIDRQTVYRWIKEYERDGEAAFDNENAVLPSTELKRLQKENADLRMENEILKKATTYFAKKKMTE